MSVSTNNQNRIKHTAVFLGWTAVMLFYLFTYFHKYRLYVFIISFVYMLYQEVITLKQPDSQTSGKEISLIDSMGRAIGITSLAFLAYYILPYWPFHFTQLTSQGYALNLITGLFDVLKRNLILEFVLLVMVILGIYKFNSHKYKVLDLIYRYMPIISVSFYILYTWTDNVRTGVFYLAISMIFLFNDILRLINQKETNINKWFITFSVILLLLIAIAPNEMAKMSERGYLEFVLLGNNFTVKNVIFIVVVIAVLEVVCWKYRDTANRISDFFLFLIYGGMLLVCCTLYNYYVGYWLIILLGYIIASLFCTYKNNAQLKEFILITGITILGIYQSHNGRLISFGLLVLCTYIVIGLSKQLNKQENHKKIPYIYRITIMIIIAMGIVTAGRVFEVRNFMSNYRIIIISTVLFLILLLGVGYNPGMFVKNKINEKMSCILFIVLFGMLCFGLTFKGGSKIQISDLKEGQIQITVDAKGKDNVIKEAKQFWLKNPIDIILADGKNTIPQEKEITDISGETSIFIEESGRLKVLAIDEYGIKTTAVRWYHVNPYESLVE